jgi:chemotaxis response regulator CheB
MPRAAAQAVPSAQVLSLESIAPTLVQLCGTGAGVAA